MFSEETRQRRYDFNLWMRNAGSVPGDASYIRVRTMMEEIIAHDTPGLEPRDSEISGGLEFLHTVLLLVAEKLE